MAQELCGLSKHLQVNNRGLLLTNLNNLGLFEVLSPCLTGYDSSVELHLTHDRHVFSCYSCRCNSVPTAFLVGSLVVTAAVLTPASSGPHSVHLHA